MGYANAVHPGGVRGDLMKGTWVYEAVTRNFGLAAAEVLNSIILAPYWAEQDGALTSLRPATSREVFKAQYFVPIARPWTPTGQGGNASLAKDLWDFTEKLLIDK